MSSKTLKSILQVVLLLSLLTTACEYDGPHSVWQPEDTGAAAPVINSVEPAAWAFAGITEISISGQNFPSTSESLTVFMGGREAEVISTSSSQIVIKPPYHESVLKEGLTISVVSQFAFTAAEYGPYELKEAATVWGSFQSRLDQIFSIAAAPDETVYAMMKGKNIVRVTADGSMNDTWGSTTFPKASDMQVMGDHLFVQRSNNAELYRVSLASGGTAERWVTLPSRVRFLGLGSGNRLYAAGTDSDIFIIQENGSFAASGHYAAFDVKNMAAYDGKLYVLATYSGSADNLPAAGIYISDIDAATGALSAPESFLDWSNAGEYAGSEFFDLAFAADGSLYIGTGHSDPVAAVQANGSIEPLYPGILSPAAEHMSWGPGDYLYINRTGSTENRNLIRVNMGKGGASI